MTAILIMGVVGINAQSLQSANEFKIAYSFLRQDVKVEVPTFTFDDNTDSHGVTVGYTRYLNGSSDRVGTVGLTGEVTASFNNDDSSLVTAQGGFTLKARNNERFQPSVRALAGVARQNVTRGNIFDVSDVTPAFTLGAGMDIATVRNSRYKLHLGADYVNTRFMGDQQHGARLNVGFIF